ncbi:hypothetical protein [Nocardioides litoris]|uniref:hypothetical protein n=1 Tax=Nocardioides litoris TaxID=1926648 RepID=UPI0011212A8A|nr:hypothetical protein [Nocardioides litoris]
MPWSPEQSQRAMVGVGGAVGLAAAVAPSLLQRSFGIPAADVTGANELGWRLFATRNLYLTARAATGDQAAIDAIGHLQALDQVVFWHAFARRSVPRRTALLAVLTSAVIVGLDAHRRSGPRPSVVSGP